jgi:hypothetical protein
MVSLAAHSRWMDYHAAAVCRTRGTVAQLTMPLALRSLT